MSFPTSLIPAARSAYRAVVRSAGITFQGDPARKAALLSAVRQTFSSPTLTPPKSKNPAPIEPTSCSSAPEASSSRSSTPSPAIEATSEDSVSLEELQKRIQEWRDVALFLRRNIVQGVKDEEKGSYRLRVTKDTELGDNTTIREPPKLPTTPFPNRNKRRRRTPEASSSPAEVSAAS